MKICGASANESGRESRGPRRPGELNLSVVGDGASVVVKTRRRFSPQGIARRRGNVTRGSRQEWCAGLGWRADCRPNAAGAIEIPARLGRDIRHGGTSASLSRIAIATASRPWSNTDFPKYCLEFLFAARA